jgi:hypothetical protein
MLPLDFGKGLDLLVLKTSGPPDTASDMICLVISSGKFEKFTISFVAANCADELTLLRRGLLLAVGERRVSIFVAQKMFSDRRYRAL